MGKSSYLQHPTMYITAIMKAKKYKSQTKCMIFINHILQIQGLKLVELMSYRVS